jgi:hypothetical protein
MDEFKAPVPEDSFSTLQSRRQVRRKLLKISLLILLLLVLGSGWLFYKAGTFEFLMDSDDSNQVDDSQSIIFYDVNILKGAAIEPATELPRSFVIVGNPDQKRYESIPVDVSQTFVGTAVAAENSVDYSLENVRLAFESVLKSSGYQEAPATDKSLAEYEENRGIKRYELESAVCTLQVTGDQSSAVIKRLCAYKNLLAAVAEFTKPFADAFTTAGKTVGSKPMLVTVTDEDIDDSIVGGYQYATASIGDIENSNDYLFVRQKDGSWQFFGSALTIQISCKTFKTVTEQSALAHLECVNQSGKLTTVKANYDL